jgi:hypothetical protein
MKRFFRLCVLAMSACAFTAGDVHAQTLDAASLRSVIEALQARVRAHPSIFPVESPAGGEQPVAEGLRYAYFGYGNPRAYQVKRDGFPAYQLVVDKKTIVSPTMKNDGNFQIEIHSGGLSREGGYSPTRYFALNAVGLVVSNGGEELSSYSVDRHLKLGYDTSTFELLDRESAAKPHFSAPLGEQHDVFRMNAVVPARWLEELGYDWSRAGSISVTISSIWDGYLSGHSHSIRIPLSAESKS